MYKCKICGKKYTDLSGLYNHIENKHSDMIPKDMNVQQYYYYMKTGRTHGNCVMCKQPTSWNKNTNKYNRFCGNPKCKDEYVRIMKSRMIAKYGKVHLLNDPEKQREMLSKRKISGTYKWSESNFETTYTGSYELDFLKTLDLFFDWDPQDVSMPSPHTYTYKYEGEDKFYIPDAFIHSLDLEIEIKDGGDNPNNHYKIQAVDKEKERLKDEVLMSQRNFHYVKITNKNYTNFFEFLKEVKDAFEKYGDEKKIPRIFKTEDIKSGKVVKPIQESCEEEILEEGFVDKLAKSLDKKVTLRNNEVFFSLQFDLRKDDPLKLKEYINNLVKSAKCEDDIRFVKELVGKSDTYYHNLLKKRPELKDDYMEYYNWLTSNDGLPKEIKDKMKKIKESTEAIEESIKSKTGLYFLSQNNMDDKTLQPRIPDNFFTKNGYEDKTTKRVCFASSIDKCLMGLSMNCTGKEFYVHVPTGNFDVITPTKKQVPDSGITGEKWICEPVKIKCVGKIKVIGDDNKPGKNFTYGNNKEAELYGWNWEYVKESSDIIYESSISFYYINKCLQNGYEEELKHYLDTYKQYYNKMLEEKPHSIPHINEDIKKAIIFIDGLSNKGVENNLLQFAKSELGDIVNLTKNSKPCRVFESEEIDINNNELVLNEVTMKLVFDQNKTRNLFGMNDLQSQVQLENYIIQRDRMGNHCSVKPGIVNENDKKIIECKLTFEESVNVNVNLKEKMEEGVTLNSLFNANDKEYKFIKEASLRLFGVYPDSIEIKE